MDREELLGALPNGAAFNAAPNYRKKETAEAFIRSLLDAIAAEHREPDDWEAQDIATAIGFIAAGMYYAALAYATRALTPVDRRLPLQQRDPNDPPAGRHLRDALDYVGGMPARNH